MSTRRALLFGALLLLVAEAVVALGVLVVIGSGVLDPNRGPRDTAVQYLTAWGARDARTTWALFPACYHGKTSYGDFSKTQDATVPGGRPVAANVKFTATAVRAVGRYRRVEVEYNPAPAASLIGNTLEVVVTDQYGDGWKVVDLGGPEHDIRDRCAGGVR